MPIQRALEAEKLIRAAELVSLDIRVFLAGPYIDPNLKKPRRKKGKEAARLRYDLLKRLEKDEYTISLREYKALLDAYAASLGHLTNSAVAEFGHAKDHADAVIILPSSPGSFTELGAFALSERICRKMLILVDAQYRGRQSYFSTGPIIQCKAEGSVVEYIDYDDVDACYDVASRFLMSIRALTLSRKITAS